MAWYEIITDPLVRYYWLEKWYGDCKGIVEYLAEWVREYTTPEDAKLAGICFVILICATVAVRTANFMREPAKGETLLDKLKNYFFNGD